MLNSVTRSIDMSENQKKYHVEFEYIYRWYDIENRGWHPDSDFGSSTYQCGESDLESMIRQELEREQRDFKIESITITNIKEI